MAPSSKSERGGNRKWGPKDHVIRQLDRVKITGQLSPRLFRKLPPRLCVSLRNIVDEEFLKKGHIFLGFTKCGRFVLSYTSDVLDDDFSFYSYHLYWWQFQVHSKLRLVRQVRLFQDEEIYSDLFLTVCEWPSDTSKVIVFGFNTSGNGMLMNMMSDENHRDIYVSTVSAPPTSPCSDCRESSAGPCLLHSFMLHTKYQVVYPFPTFQPAFQLKKDHVVLLNTSYSLVACAISVHPAGNIKPSQILFSKHSHHHTSRSPASPSGPSSPSSDSPPPPENACLSPPGTPPAVARAREFVAGIFRRAREASGLESQEKADDARAGPSREISPRSSGPDSPAWHRVSGEGSSRANSNLSEEPSYVNYTRLRYILGEVTESDQESEYEDDKISLPFLVTDLNGRHLKPMKEKPSFQGQHLSVEQLTLDFEYVINEVIRHDASWSRQFCSFSDYDIVILEMCPETHQVIINIGLLLLAFPAPHEEGQLRPKTHHTSLKVAWDLHTGIFSTLSVGDLIEVKGQTSGSVWSSYRKSCVDTVMKWLVPESSVRYVNRMTNEALHKGCSLKVLADSVRYTWIVL
ncbi:DDB1- and CUL4-associated factor 15 isoform X2 [Spea bombifrons]|uniref:DDB1- and CUL4-associated factor 15 isoform X2 n=1 Tax=Spea bombifrons TaxID=233779 RepID=UPI00234A8654|nr:DDB1- and CUL4-associated factor 15 isoform X2 [Spea bombifrons]